jgi:hypothetical protein
VHAEQVEAGHAPPNAHVASFFSGGVDSFYNALKHVREIDDLVFIHGFDVPLWDTALRGLVSSRLHEAAGELGKPLLEVETNLRTVLDPYTHWNLQSHGAALGCVALALAPQLRRVYIGATHSYFGLRFHGSHPMLDPLWGHETMEVVHDGCEYERWPKAERIIANETVLRYLRVCWTNPRTTYNCGRCSNCVMMMVFLRATGMAEKCLTFPPLDLAQIASVEIATSSVRNYFDDLLLVAEENGLDPALCDALRQRVKRAEDEGIGAYQASPELRRSQAEAAALKLDIKRVGAELKRIKESRSWRLTAPLRSASSLARRIVVTTPKKR